MAEPYPLPQRIAKRASDPDKYRRTSFSFENARSALKAFLASVSVQPEDLVLLPAYVGWSPREGSGVLDPIRSLGLRYAFYRLDQRLRIDVGHLRQLMDELPVTVLLVIHYFGYRDPGYPEAVALARQHDAVVMEDEAHSMLTDLIGGTTGRLGDAAIYSLHKILPVPDGGMLVLNAGGNRLEPQIAAARSAFDLWQFDLAEIAERRRRNAFRLTELLGPLAGTIDPLWGDPADDEVPQTYPVIVRTGSRDRLYDEMNQAGVGVVSLYHTLVKGIPAEFEASHQLSRRMLNLPVHQEVDPEALPGVVQTLASLTERSSPE